MDAEPGAVRLDEYDRDEWFDICRSLAPGLSREEFDGIWEEFQREKAARLAAQKLN